MQHPETLTARTERRRNRWTRLNGFVSAGIGAVAISAGVYLGVTAPATSPVQPAAVGAAAAPGIAGTSTALGGAVGSAGADATPGDDDTAAVQLDRGGRDGAGPRGAGPGGRR